MATNNAKTTAKATTAAKVEEKKTTPVKTETKPAAKTAEKKAAPAKKAPAKKTTTKKAAAKKTTAKKTTTRKTTTAKTDDVKAEVFVQFAGTEISEKAIMQKVVAAWEAEGKKVSAIKKAKLYIKPEDKKAYYVINEGLKSGSTGAVNL